MERRIFNFFADLGERLPGFRTEKSSSRFEIIANQDLADKATSHDNHPRPVSQLPPVESELNHQENFPYER